MTETNCGFWLEGKFVLRVRGLRRFINNLMDEADCGFWLKGGFVLRLEELRRFVGGLAAGADCSFCLGRDNVATIWASMRELQCSGLGRVARLCLGSMGFSGGRICVAASRAFGKSVARFVRLAGFGIGFGEFSGGGSLGAWRLGRHTEGNEL